MLASWTDSLSSVISFFFLVLLLLFVFSLDTLLLKVLPLPMYDVIERTVASRPPIIKYHVPYA